MSRRKRTVNETGPVRLPKAMDRLGTRNLLESLLRNMQGGVLVVDNSKRIVLFNKAAQRITGFLEAEVLGKACKEAFGSELTMEPFDLREETEADEPVRNTEFGFPGKDGRLVPVSSTSFPLRGDKGDMKGTAMIFRDITRLTALETELMQSDRLAILGQLAAGVAHEINNPINGILTYVKLLLKKLDRGDPSSVVPEFKKYLSIMEREVNRIGSTTRNLLDFSRRAEPDVRPIQVNDVIEQSLMLLRDQVTVGNIELRSEGEKSLPRVMGDFGQLQQVFVNLMMNAIQAMDRGGKIEIRTSVEVTDEAPDESFVRIDVSDTGHGISNEHMPKLFEPFFTTKHGEKGTGVGLGLPIVQRIVEDHEGLIDVRSEVGKGTTFTIRLPSA